MSSGDGVASAFIAWYLFLAGAGAGAFLIGGVVDLAIRANPYGLASRVSPVTDAGMIVGPILVIISSVFLLFDLGVPERAIRVFLTPLTSIIGFGAWTIVLFVSCALGALIVGRFFDSKFSSIVEFILHICATLLSMCLLVYSGVYLSLFSTVPFLNTPLIPALFVASGLTSGMAVLILIGFTRKNIGGISKALENLIAFDMVLIVFEIVILVIFFLMTALADDVSALSAQSLISGRLAGVFWLGIVVIGLILPFTVDTICRRMPDSVLLSIGAVCTLIGGICLRYALLLAAMRFNLADMSSIPFWF